VDLVVVEAVLWAEAAAADAIVDNARHLLALVEHLLVLSKGESDVCGNLSRSANADSASRVAVDLPALLAAHGFGSPLKLPTDAGTTLVRTKLISPPKLPILPPAGLSTEESFARHLTVVRPPAFSGADKGHAVRYLVVAPVADIAFVGTAD
jgi:hypothetical protein